jgi:hypothetical protein
LSGRIQIAIPLMSDRRLVPESLLPGSRPPGQPKATQKVGFLRFTMYHQSTTHKPTRSHRIYENWSKHHELPWICFLECAIMVLYFVLGLCHQSDSAVFTEELADAIRSFFLANLSIPVDDDGNYPLVIPVYLTDQVIQMATLIGQSLLDFADQFPCAGHILSEGTFSMYVVDLEGTNVTVVFDRGNFSMYFQPILDVIVSDIAVLALSGRFDVRLPRPEFERHLERNLAARFARDVDTNVVMLDFNHWRDGFLEHATPKTMFDSPDIEVAIALIAAASLAILLHVRYVISSYAFAREKSHSKFGGLRSILWRKFDKWSLLGLATHIATITAKAIYCRLGLQRTREVPQASIALTISSSIHCFLLVR